MQSQVSAAQSQPDWGRREVLEQTLAAAPIAITMVDAAGEIVFANHKLVEMFGYAQDELLGKRIELLIPERFHRTHVEHRSQYVENPHTRPMGVALDLVGRRKNGKEFPLEAGLAYIRTDSSMLVIATITDITRRKQNEEILEQRVEVRTRELERRRQVSDGLRDILTVLNSEQPLEEILHHIASQACHLLYADASAIYRWLDHEHNVAIQASHGLPPDRLQTIPIPLLESTQVQVLDIRAIKRMSNSIRRDADEKDTPLQKTVPAVSPTISHDDTKFTVTLSMQKTESTPDSSDTHSSEPVAGRPSKDPYDHSLDDLEDSGYSALLTVPLIIKDEPYGSLILYYRGARQFSAEDIELATTVGDHTALAIENARLRTQVERTAVAAERSRIARDLHDSVTQTLFSASLIAEVLPRLWHRDEAETERRLDELGQLTRGALAEMRTLLLELRPATLMEVELKELVRQLGEAITGRARVPITLDIQDQGVLPPDVKVALYHITQEALNNVAKHARASHAWVALIYSPQHAELAIKDDGCGFVLKAVTAEHLGLTIMHERAQAINARLDVNSELGQGTEVLVSWDNTSPFQASG